MPGPYYAVMGGTRICDTDRVDQSGSDDNPVTNWTIGNDFIVCININSGGKDTEAAQYKLRWRNVTDSGSYADLGSSGELTYNSATVLVQGTNIPEGTRRCSSQGGDSWQAGEEVEGASLCDSIDLADEYETEIHFGVDTDNALASKEYAFELYDETNGASKGNTEGGATLTTATSEEVIPIAKFALTWVGKAIDVDETITPAKMVLMWVGKALKANEAITIAKFALTWVGKTLKANIAIIPSKLSLTWVGKNITVIAPETIEIAKLVLTWVGKAVKASKTIAVAKFALTWVGKGVKINEGITLAKTSLAWAGKAVTIVQDVTIEIAKLALTWLGKGFYIKETIRVAKMTLTWLGKSITVIAGEGAEAAKHLKNYYYLFKPKRRR